MECATLKTVGKFNYFDYKEKRFEKLSASELEDLIFDLINAISSVRTPIETALLIHDLLTEKEVRNLAKRLRIAKLILKGLTTDEIIREMHCSASTVSKVRMWLENSGQGLIKVIQKLPRRTTVYRPKRIPGIGYGLPQILLHFATSYKNTKEKRLLGEFLEKMRTKSSLDRDFREELRSEFSDTKIKKKSK